MKCPNCGAEIATGSKFCEFCGTQISYEMQREQEQLNKSGCPKCGSTNIAFTRENQGEVRKKKSKQVVHTTVGYCKDCGYTWYPEAETLKKKRTFLWILGWIFIFPIPLTILILRKKDLNQKVKYGVIAAAWILYIVLIIISRTNNAKKQDQATVDSHPSFQLETTVESSAPKQESSKIEESKKEESFKTEESSATEESSEETTEESSEEEIPEEESSKDESSEEEFSEEPETVDQDLIRPEVKEAIDSYEAFIDEYCDFMESYDASDMTLLAKYAELLQKEVEMSQKFDAITDQELTDAETLYYSEVSLRCSQKLLSAASKQ